MQGFDNMGEVIEDCVQKIKPMVLKKIYYPDCDDVLQEIRLAFYTAFPKFKGDSKLYTYAHIIAKRRIADFFRKTSKHWNTYQLPEGFEIPDVPSSNPWKRAHKAIENNDPEKTFLTTGAYFLTESERAVFRLIGEGFNNDEIAEALFITRNTLASHIKKVYIKMHCHDRTKVALFSYKFFNTSEVLECP
jgi:RNA polymerase sigma factor (sigma-70 family)